MSKNIEKVTKNINVLTITSRVSAGVTAGFTVAAITAGAICHNKNVASICGCLGTISAMVSLETAAQRDIEASSIDDAFDMPEYTKDDLDRLANDAKTAKFNSQISSIGENIAKVCHQDDIADACERVKMWSYVDNKVAHLKAFEIRKRHLKNNGLSLI